jgi:hypothetical protein
MDAGVALAYFLLDELDELNEFGFGVHARQRLPQART